jgi:hypothetical protein
LPSPFFDENEKIISWYFVSRVGANICTINRIILGPSPYICSVLKSVRFFSKRKKFKSNICSAVWGGPVDTLPGSDYVKKFHRRFAQFHYKIFVQNDNEKNQKNIKKSIDKPGQIVYNEYRNKRRESFK